MSDIQYINLYIFLAIVRVINFIFVYISIHAWKRLVAELQYSHVHFDNNNVAVLYKINTIKIIMIQK